MKKFLEESPENFRTKFHGGIPVGVDVEILQGIPKKSFDELQQKFLNESKCKSLNEFSEQFLEETRVNVLDEFLEEFKKKSRMNL